MVGCVALVSGMLLTAEAGASEISRRMAAGRLLFGEAPDVSLKAQEIYISPDRARLKYVVRNDGATDRTVVVAFPLPDIAPLRDNSGIDFAIGTTADFLETHIAVDGKPVKLEIEQRALALGLDRTELLREHGIPLEAYLSPLDPAAPAAALNALTQRQRADFRALGLLRQDDDYLATNWTVSTTLYWTVMLAAGRDTVIEQDYQPYSDHNLDPPAGLYLDDEGDARRDFCISDDDQRALAELHEGRTNGKTYTAFSDEVGFVLGVKGRDPWPLMNLKVVIEAREPLDFVFACLDGAKRISQSRLELAADRYWALHDLDVLFVTSHQLEN
ncbi:hypothetical protein GCM10007920_44600 [Ciceribacter naphthalenivorans]|uniref:DUF4424 domain-containing protein n=3 Tax=Pseudomonadota TaxID=1224 RepID=A0A512HFI5_9HYPH|nr:hypothetical protein RNA01_10620 [Ciceribacter naphthalenivorans]GLR24666.1 hypothetical protein GCM10007920_44600 [Ciceribacter naphthalenivorans]GLT07522.1 hypothetical protein GCM10007926_44600 [Sphingomonas psychrolutea]